MEQAPSFDHLNLTKQLRNAIADMELVKPTPIQSASFNVIRSGKDVVGIAQTGTGKTLAYGLPLLQDLKFSKQINPRILILVPTRELVVQVVNQFEQMAAYTNHRITGVYGGVNIKNHTQLVLQGMDILVATPGRLYDLVLNRSLQLKSVNKLIIDEVDVMLDLGFIFQLSNILELLPTRRQNIMFSATMTNEIDDIIDRTFIAPVKISIAISGTPLDNISQYCYPVKNFHTKVNLLSHLLSRKEEYKKVLVFVSTKRNADRLFELMEPEFGNELSIVHSNKSQNYRLKSMEQFDEGVHRIMITTDVMARGLDFNKMSHVFNFDTPDHPENYIHRIGRTGRAGHVGKSILFFTEKEEESKISIEILMSREIDVLDFPAEVNISQELIPDERPRVEESNYNRNAKKHIAGPSTHEKKAKNKKVNLGGSYRRELAKKYKKPQTRGDKIQNLKKKGRK